MGDPISGVRMEIRFYQYGVEVNGMRDLDLLGVDCEAIGVLAAEGNIPVVIAPLEPSDRVMSLTSMQHSQFGNARFVDLYPFTALG